MGNILYWKGGINVLERCRKREYDFNQVTDERKEYIMLPEKGNMRRYDLIPHIITEATKTGTGNQEMYHLELIDKNFNYSKCDISNMLNSFEKRMNIETIDDLIDKKVTLVKSNSKVKGVIFPADY